MLVMMVQAVYSPGPDVAVLCPLMTRVVVITVTHAIGERHRELSMFPALVKAEQHVQRHTGDDQPEYRLRATLYARLRHDHRPAIDHLPPPGFRAAPPS